MSRSLKYFRNQILLHKAVLMWPINRLLRSGNIGISVFAANLKYRLRRKNIRITYDKNTKLFAIHDGDKTHSFGDLMRGVNFLYVNGLTHRADTLFQSYLLGQVTFRHDDVVIDCGANYGDLYLSLDGKIEPGRYITFEPGILEHESIKQNAPEGTHNRKGLSNKTGVSRFYVDERDADSSIIEPTSYSHYVDIKTTTLNEYVKSNKIDKIRLLKLEAEGFEPEILDGSNAVLDRVDYVAVDGGYERGKDQEETFSDTVNALLGSNFEMVSVNFLWGRALFVRKDI